MSYPQSFAEELKHELARTGIVISRASEYDSINEAYSLRNYFVDASGDIVWPLLISELIALGLMDYNCSKCGRHILGVVPEADVCGFVYCDDCADEHLAYCEGCDDRCPKHAMIKTDDGYFCRSCYEEAENELHKATHI